MKTGINIIVSFAVSIIVVLSANYFFKPKKVGFVRTGFILQNYKGMLKANEVFEQEVKIVQGNLDTLRNRYEKLKEMESNGSAISISKNELSNKLNIAKEDFEKYNSQATEQVDKRKQELTGMVINEINQSIVDYAKKNNYQYILGTTEQGSLLYGEEKDDLTEIILNLLNEKKDEDKK